MVESMEDLVEADHRASIKYETTDPLVLLVARMAIKYNVGLIVVDEIQNLLLSGHQDRAKMLNFLVSMANVARIPIMTMGTPLARDLMANQVRQARRTGDMGTIMWDRMPRDPEWEFFLEGMFRYQWVATAAEKTPRLSKVIHAETAGIPALVVRLFQLAQLRAIADGTERVTAKVLTEVAQERFSLLRPMLDAIRAGRDVSRWEGPVRRAPREHRPRRRVGDARRGRSSLGEQVAPESKQGAGPAGPALRHQPLVEGRRRDPGRGAGPGRRRPRRSGARRAGRKPPDLRSASALADRGRRRAGVRRRGRGLQAVATANDRARKAAKRPRRGSTEG